MRSARAGELSRPGSAAVIRSLLYVPASSERFISKAHERGADAIILDLEDAVVPAEKSSARARLASAVASVGQRGAAVFVRINSEAELDAVEKSAHEARAFGFDGASCVHPSVVPILNRVFSPSEEALHRARRLIAAAEQAKARGEGAFTFEGKMVDEPVVKRAHALLARDRNA